MKLRLRNKPLPAKNFLKMRLPVHGVHECRNREPFGLDKTPYPGNEGASIFR